MITKEEVQHIAKLARLDLAKEERKKMQKELSAILDYFKILQEIDTKKVESTSHPILTKPYLRKDESKREAIERTEKLIEMAPEKKERYIRTKAVL